MECPKGMSMVMAPVSPDPLSKSYTGTGALRAMRILPCVLWLHPGVVVRDTDGSVLLWA